MKIILFLCIFLGVHFSLEGACVKSPWVNLKEGPSSAHETKWVVPKNTPLKIIKRSRGWYLVEEVDRVRSWVDRRKLTEDYFCGIVKWEKTRIKTNSKRKKSKLAFYDESFKILKFKNKHWVLVRNQLGTEGLIRKQSLWVY